MSETTEQNTDRIDDLALRIEVECNRRGLFKKELAQRIGRSPQALNSILRTGNMRATVMRDIAAVLDIPMEMLFQPVTREEWVESKRARATRRKKEAAGADATTGA